MHRVDLGPGLSKWREASPLSKDVRCRDERRHARPLALGRGRPARSVLGPGALARREALHRDGYWVAALALPILVSHQSEEWVRPGGFLPFCNERVLGSSRPTWPLTERDGFHVNVSLGWGSAVAGALLWRRTPVPAAAVLFLEAGNALMHGSVAARERRYNPGLATGGLLMAGPTPRPAAPGWPARAGSRAAARCSPPRPGSPSAPACRWR